MTTSLQLTGVDDIALASILSALNLGATADPRTAIYRIIENLAKRYEDLSTLDRPTKMSIIKEAANLDIDTQVRTFTIRFDLQIQATAVDAVTLPPPPVVIPPPPDPTPPPVATLLTPSNLTSNTSNAPFVVSQSSTLNSHYAAFRAFDSNLGEPDWVCSNTSMPQWISMDLGVPKTVTQYELSASYAGAVNGGMPSNFVLQGSINNIDWINVDTRNGVNGYEPAASKSFTVASPASYRYWRIYVTQAVTSGALCRVGEIELYGY
jgi:hypothetical protein